MIQIVNGRVLRDKTIQQAMMAPFRQTLLPGKFPAVLAFLEVNPSQIDVNVHPTKSEIRFLDSRKIFSIFDETIQALIRAHGTIGFAGGTSHFSPSEDVPFFSPKNERTPWLQLQASEAVHRNYQAPLQVGAPEKTGGLFDFRTENFLGTLFRTFLAFDLGEELGLIDQHAAHERIRYEKLKLRALHRAQNADVQSLLIPEVVRIEEMDIQKLEKRVPLLQQIGFQAEIFGSTNVLFRSIPPEWGNFDLKARLRNLLDSLMALEESALATEELFLDDRLFEKLASEACHSSVRAGDRLGSISASELLAQLQLCKHPWNCPHGRPTVVRVPRARFEEWFQRLV